MLALYFPVIAISSGKSMDNMSYQRAKTLLEKYKSDQLSEEEKALVEKWLFNYNQEAADLSEETINALGKEVWADLQPREIRSKRLWPQIAAAACLVLALGTGLFFYLNHNNKEQPQIAVAADGDITPGGNKAILTLANGEKISLTDADEGVLVKQSGIHVSKTSDGQLVYQVIENIVTDADGTPEYNTVETPRGGQYQIDLPDGTRVWLNAASQLKFPLSFAQLKERKVELKGEAYFEVEKDAQKPFIVAGDKQTVSVLGTHFNVNSYADEPIVKTTLLEGAVKVQSYGTAENNYRILTPGQQAQLSSVSGAVTVIKVDPQVEIAWKNGKFSFENEPIENIMRQIARWYDVEVIYKDNVTEKTVWGSITRYSNVSKVLSVVERTGKIHFKVKGRRVIVSK